MTADFTTPDELDLWGEYVARRGGLSVTGRKAALARSVAERANATGARSATDYYLRVSGSDSGGEWQQLVGLLLNGETSFFRDPDLFAALARDVLPALDRRGGPLHFWSAGCSTGQEAYSLAMTAFDSGLADDRLTVWATDVCESSLLRARRGEYPAAEVNRLPAEIARRYFEPVGAGFRTCDRLRACVVTRRVDLLTDGFDLPPQDVILCQNVLYYYAADARTAIARRLGERLTPGGLLFLGAAEGIGVRVPGLCPVRVGEVWAHRRPDPNPR